MVTPWVVEYPVTAKAAASVPDTTKVRALPTTHDALSVTEAVVPSGKEVLLRDGAGGGKCGTCSVRWLGADAKPDVLVATSVSAYDGWVMPLNMAVPVYDSVADVVPPAAVVAPLSAKLPASAPPSVKVAASPAASNVLTVVRKVVVPSSRVVAATSGADGGPCTAMHQ